MFLNSVTIIIGSRWTNIRNGIQNIEAFQSGNRFLFPLDIVHKLIKVCCIQIFGGYKLAHCLFKLCNCGVKLFLGLGGCKCLSCPGTRAAVSNKFLPEAGIQVCRLLKVFFAVIAVAFGIICGGVVLHSCKKLLHFGTIHGIGNLGASYLNKKNRVKTVYMRAFFKSSHIYYRIVIIAGFSPNLFFNIGHLIGGAFHLFKRNGIITVTILGFKHIILIIGQGGYTVSIIAEEGGVYIQFIFASVRNYLKLAMPCGKESIIRLVFYGFDIFKVIYREFKLCGSCGNGYFPKSVDIVDFFGRICNAFVFNAFRICDLFRMHLCAVGKRYIESLCSYLGLVCVFKHRVSIVFALGILFEGSAERNNSVKRFEPCFILQRCGF